MNKSEKEALTPMSPNFTLIAGPCSAESEEQLRNVAEMIMALGAKGFKIEAMRAGVWKPRTRPGHFEGYGEQALQWIDNIRRENPSLEIITEVATTAHVRACVEHNIKRVWLGARTVSNPFAVQEIADILKDSDIKKVGVKNPVSPDLALWMGALERLEKAGVEVEAIHRGFGIYDARPYRNAPLWELPIELKRRCQNLRILCDPSHIGGKDQYVEEISQLAIDLEMDGLMIEVHPKPEEALSDAPQQLTTQQYQDLLQKLRFKQQNSASSRLEPLRCFVDDIDHEIVSLLARRFDLVRQMGEIKKEENLSVLQMQRWKFVLTQRAQWAKERGIDEDFIKELFRCIHAESVNLQK